MADEGAADIYSLLDPFWDSLRSSAAVPCENTDTDWQGGIESTFGRIGIECVNWRV